MASNFIVISIVGDDKALTRTMSIIWANVLIRRFFTVFLEDSDEIYFRSLIDLFKGKAPRNKVYLFLEIRELRKKIALVEINSDLLLLDSIDGDIERANLRESKAIIVLSKRSQLRPEPLYSTILKIKGKRRFIRKIVRDPVAIVIENQRMLTPLMLSFLSKRFKKYRIFKIDTKIENFNNFAKIQDLSQPFIWILEKLLKTKFYWFREKI